MDTFKPQIGLGSNITTTVLGALAAWLLYYVVRALYNISPFHPLAGFPGPRLAAATILYEFWFDMVLVGRYTREIKRMHDVYGPIVRISPDELHCSDPAFYDEIYAAAGRKRNKQAHYLNMLTGPVCLSAFGSVDHDLHRNRRRPMDKFFSRQQISKMEVEIQSLTQRLCNKLLRRAGEVLDMQTVYSCLVSDVIASYCFGETMGLVDQEGWEPNFREPLKEFLKTSFMFRYFPVTRALVHLTPYLTRYMKGSVGLLFKEYNVYMPGRVRKAKEDHQNGVVRKQMTVFEGILDSSLPEHEKTVYRLSGDGFSLTSAGTETTAWTLTVINYFLLAQPETYARVAAELNGLDPHSLSWSRLEQFPYLSGVISEGLRLSYGIPVRSPRIATDEDLIYGGKSGGRTFNYTIPRNTAIGMSQWILHHDEDIFPDSNSFSPERWLNDRGEHNRALEKYLVPFSRGSRVCLGMNLAYCELYISTAAMVLRLLPSMNLYETTVDDVKYDHDLIVSQQKKGSKGVRVVISQH